MSINSVTLLGRVGNDPELRTTQQGNKVANLRLATSRFTGSGDQRQEHTEWHTLVVFSRQAEVVGEYVKKGDQFAVQGRLQTRKWTDQSGNDRYTTEIVVETMSLIGNRRDRQGDAGDQESGAEQPEFA